MDEYKLVKEVFLDDFIGYDIRKSDYPRFNHLYEPGVTTSDRNQLIAFVHHLNRIDPEGTLENLPFLWEVFNQTKTK